MPRLLTHGLVACAFSFLSLVLTWPLAAHISTHVPGAGIGDNVTFLWNFWWMREALASERVDYRRVEFVGPKVGGELIEAGVTAVILALLAMLIYIWFRFEWQFGVGAVIALFHDVLLTIGIFSLLGLEFNLSTVAAILTIAGYSINDTVVVYDRVRENLRRFKAMPLPEPVPTVEVIRGDKRAQEVIK